MSFPTQYTGNFNEKIDDWFPTEFGLPMVAPSGGSPILPGSEIPRMPYPSPPGGGQPQTSDIASLIGKMGTNPGAALQQVLGQGLGLDKVKFFKDVIGPMLAVAGSSNRPLFAIGNKRGGGFALGGMGGGGGNSAELLAMVRELINKQNAGAGAASAPPATPAAGTAPFAFPVRPIRAQPMMGGAPPRFELPSYSSCS